MKYVTIIGAGAVGSAVARGLSSGGVRIAAVYSEHGRSAARLARNVKAKNSGSVTSLKSVSDTVIIAVPDDRIADVAEHLFRNAEIEKGTIILHTSGALSSDELSAVKKKASAGSFHPLQTFPKRPGMSGVRDIWFAAEGEARAVTACRTLAKRMHAHCFTLSKKDKTLYHIAAVFASNYQVTLYAVVAQLAESIGIPKKKIWRIFRPLIERTISNVFATTPEEALTGPIARGDYTTISKHVDVLESSKALEHLLPLYSTLGVETAKLAKRKNNAR